MVTPFTPDGGLDLPRAQALAASLVGDGRLGGSDGLVLAGTTGEAPTLTQQEQVLLVQAVRDALGPAVPLVVGASSNATAHAVELAQAAEKAGADAVLVTAPYYNRPPQEGVRAHALAVADAVGIPVVLYDIPLRTGVAFSADTLVRLAEHPGIVAVKDAKGDLASTSWVLATSDLTVYSGDDVLTLPFLAVGAVGVVSTIAHVAGRRVAAMVAAYEQGRPAEAAALHRALLPVCTGITRSQAAITVKAALALLGEPVGSLRLPLLPASAAEVEQLRADLVAGGVPVADGSGWAGGAA